MTGQIVNRRELDFQLFEALKIETLMALPRFAEHTKETLTAVLDTAEKIAAEKFAPHNRDADENEPRFDGKSVAIIPEVKVALTAFINAGFISAAHDFDRGGMQLPTVVAHAAMSIFTSANAGTTAYPFLTIANSNLIDRFGSETQKKKYLLPLLAGRFFGTMALTEPQAGSSLADIKTTATPTAAGDYLISGNKIFISAGDHDLSENIIHLVLAKIPGAPVGVKGISLFIVPKIQVNEAGNLGTLNDVTLTGLIHKMGYRGTTSTMLAFGEKGQCRGELVGEAHKGLSYMFHMMNEARIGVGIGAAMLGYRGYLSALDYATQRTQGRLVTERDAQTPQVPLIEHADVRRMLLAQKTYVEGSYGLCLYCARLVDQQKAATNDPAMAITPEEAGLLLDLLTPVAKSWPSQWCLEANSLAIQVHGGYGYTRDYPVEQYYRDNRLNPIHEGTHGIQALDLLGRKVTMKQGAAVQLFARELQKTIGEATTVENLVAHATQLTTAVEDVADTLQKLYPVLAQNPTLALANASVFLEAFGHTVIAWIWLKQALAAQRGLSHKDQLAKDVSFYQGKLAACTWFYRWELPKAKTWNNLLRSLDDTTLRIPRDGF